MHVFAAGLSHPGYLLAASNKLILQHGSLCPNAYCDASSTALYRLFQVYHDSLL
jgi:hypothetical protein